MTYRDKRKQLEACFMEAGIEDYSIDAGYLMMHVLNSNMGRLLLIYDEEIPDKEAAQIDALAQRRIQHEPLQYILGEQEFMGRVYKCREGCLIPRQDTELLVEEAYNTVRKLQGPIRALDMCTGSGCIAVSLAAEFPDLQIVAADLSEDALMIARENAELHSVNVDFIQTDMFANIEGVFDLIVSNPPYIKSRIIPRLMPEVREFEPMMALDGGEDGLKFYTDLCQNGLSHLKSGGYLMVEIDDDQGDEVSQLFETYGLENVKVLKDLTGADRVVTAFKPRY